MPPIFESKNFAFDQDQTPDHVEAEPDWVLRDPKKLSLIQRVGGEATLLAADIDDLNTGAFLLHARKAQLTAKCAEPGLPDSLEIEFPDDYWDRHTGSIYNT